MTREKAELKPQPIQSFAEWKVPRRVAPRVKPEAKTETTQQESAKAEQK
ncbi:MAG: hypothetical protein ACOZFS_10490 [Thermodesulfobacteriota bacterium]